VENPITSTEKSEDPELAPTRAPERGSASYGEEPGKLDDIADRLGFRDWLEKRPALKHAYRIGVGVVGFIVTVAGIIMIPFPGPGWLVVIAGLAILATEFEWAKRLLDFTKKHVKAWTSWVGRQSLLVKALLAIATAAFVYAIFVVTLHITGVPDWIPSWVPLWR
jgi:uncharacterized protein (TIGR02611 family)